MGFEFLEYDASTLGLRRTMDRRRRSRVLLRCALQLYRKGSSQPFKGETQNLSSAGFYCLLHEPVDLGDRLECVLTMPGESFNQGKGDVNLLCKVEVIRIEDQPTGLGVACRIEHYSLLMGRE
jgi:PilZ domain